MLSRNIQIKILLLESEHHNMKDRFDLYTKALKQLLAGMDKKCEQYSEQYKEIHLLQSRFLISITNLRKYGENDPGERAVFNRIIEQLHDICEEVMGMNFDDFSDLIAKREQEQAVEIEDPLRPYIGDWSAIQEGRFQQQMSDQIKEAEIPLKSKRNLQSGDPLALYKQVPLHAYILYSAQDQAMATYILEQWDSMISQSGRFCDIYQSIDQLSGLEDGYDFLYNSHIIKESGIQIEQTELPGLFFWDHDEDCEFISFSQCTNESEITKQLRIIFSQLSKSPNIETVKRIKNVFF
jgi:hypothetical protein